MRTFISHYALVSTKWIQLAAKGYFNAYGNAARRQNHDHVVHLGGYIYENADPTGERGHKPPHVLLSLHNYRTRHNQYKTDPDLQLLFKDWAWIPTWDDHGIVVAQYTLTVSSS